MPHTMDGYLMEWADGTWSVSFGGYQRVSGVSESAARKVLAGLADGRALWLVNDVGGAAYEELVL